MLNWPGHKKWIKGSVRDNVWLKSKGKKNPHTNVKRSEMFHGEIALEVDLRE